MREWVARSRAAQGLPPTIEDPEILRRLGAIVLRSAQKAPARNRRPRRTTTEATTRPGQGDEEQHVERTA